MQVKAKKSLGQNFLIDNNIIQKIVNAVDLKDKQVIEIGPGQGAITELIVKKAARLTAFEIDKDMIEILQNKINDDNFILKHEDFLKANLEQIGNNNILVANIPYYITSDILFKVFENVEKFEKAIIMMQKDVALRITANPGSSEYSKLSVCCQYLSKVTKLFDVSPTCFVPAPKVFSSVVEFDFNKIDWEKTEPFFDFVKKSFAFRRKTLLNNLMIYYDKNKIIAAIEKNNYKLTVRPQEINVSDYESLYLELTKKETS
ncbi:16S rRNA (adenine(1518)-N(6)/adenine(1519)-N(6))-dimethyltransferase RsmA [Mycoplasma sp. 128]|uniref:16S rRNA (adenine(1518)-N(6)/adenine(1519)-N(6))- dimethyltransferase RsmA n=1 Tax=Mycoplasma sp. 3341 TaxID=3447506 RepID=UPI003F656284